MDYMVDRVVNKHAVADDRELQMKINIKYNLSFCKQVNTMAERNRKHCFYS